MGVYLTGMHLMGVGLMSVHLGGVRLIGMYLTGVYVMGMHLIGLHLIGVYIMAFHGRASQSCVRTCGFWPGALFRAAEGPSAEGPRENPPSLRNARSHSYKTLVRCRLIRCPRCQTHA